MDDFLKDFAEGEPYEGPYKASKMFKLTIEALLHSLSPIFHQIRKAAMSGLDYLEIKEELSDDQRWILEKYGYDVIEFDENDDEYQDGFRLQIQWANAEDETDE
jgi:hypothetical protein